MTGEWVIVVDAVITRRKRYHVVFDPEGRETFRSRLIWDCFQHLDAEGVESYWCRASDPRHPNTVAGVIVRKETPPWQN